MTTRRKPPTEQPNRTITDEHGNPVTVWNVHGRNVVIPDNEQSEAVASYEIETNEAEENDLSDVERITVMLGEHGTESTAWVYRLTPETGKKGVFLCKLPASEFDVSVVQANYGAGKYKLCLYQAGHKGLVAPPMTFEIGEPLKKIDPQNTALTSQTLAETIAASIRAALPATSPMPDPNQQMIQSLQMLKLMRETLGPAPVPAGASNPIETMQMLFAGMREMREMAHELAPQKGEESELGMIAKAFAPVAEALTKQHQQSNGEAAQYAALSHEQREPHDQPNQPEQEIDEMQIFVRALAKNLLSAARANEPVEKHAQKIANNILLSDEVILSVLEPVNENGDLLDWWQQIVSIVPEAAPHKTWFESLRLTILAGYDIEEEPSPPTSANASEPTRLPAARSPDPKG